MSTLAASSVWFDSVTGGWPNLLQGLVSAAITGAVAALVSFAVVRRSDASMRALSRQQEARNNLVGVLEDSIATFVGVPDSRPWRADFEEVASLTLKLRLAAALIAEQDVRLAQKVQDIADKLAQVAAQWKTKPALQEDNAALERYNEAWHVVEPLHETVINWLGDITPKYRHSVESTSPGADPLS